MILKDLFIFVNIYDILIDFLWSYEQKKPQRSILC